MEKKISFSMQSRKKKILLALFLFFSFICIIFLNSYYNNKKNKKLFFQDNSLSRFSDLSFFANKDKLYNLLNHILVFIKKLDNLKGSSKILELATKRNILFYGESGTGKTQLVRKLAYALNKYFFDTAQIKDSINFLQIHKDNIENEYIGVSERNLTDIFEMTNNSKYKLTILFFDEIDSHLIKRDMNCPGGNLRASLYTHFLSLLDGSERYVKNNYILIGTTNQSIRAFSDEVRRRFGYSICFEYFSFDECSTIIDEYRKIKKITKILEGEERNDFIKNKMMGKTLTEINDALDEYFIGETIYVESTINEKLKKFVDEI